MKALNAQARVGGAARRGGVRGFLGRVGAGIGRVARRIRGG